MIGFRLAAQRPPDAKRVKDDVVMRFDHIYEVAPELMTEHTPQQDIPAWDTLRIVESRWEHPTRPWTAFPAWELGATANAAFRRDVFDDPEVGLMDVALGPGTPSGVGEDSYLLVVRTRSEGDRRRTYLRLVPGVLSSLTAPRLDHAERVVFVCTHNSARSQLAAALWRDRIGGDVASAGTIPAQRVHPRAIRVAHAHGLALDPAGTNHVGDVVHDDDLIIAVCDNAHEDLTGPIERLGDAMQILVVL